MPGILLQDPFWCFFCQELEDQSYYGKFLSLPQVREAIHVGNRTFSDGADVEKYLREDTLQSVKPWLVEIMDHYKVSREPGGVGGGGPAQNSWATVTQGDFFLLPILLLPFKNTSSILVIK